MDYIPIIAGWLLAAWLCQRTKPRLTRAWVAVAAIMALLAIPVPNLLSNLSLANYNFAELFRTDTPLAASSFVLIFLLAPLTARWAADGDAKTGVGWAMASCLIAWGLLRRSVTVESIDDVLGSPIWGGGLWDAEYILRFAALYLSFLWLPVFFSLRAIRNPRTGGLVLLGFSAILVLATPTIIRHYSPSDNVRTLFKPGGGHWFAVMVLLIVWCAILSRRVGRWTPAVLLAASALGWSLINLSVNVPSIHGVHLGYPLFAAILSLGLLCILPALPPARAAKETLGGQ